VSDNVMTIEEQATLTPATEKETPADSTGTGSVAPGGSKESSDQAGGSQDSSEGGGKDGQETRPRGPSKLDTIRELRSRLREQKTYWESEVGSLKEQLQTIQQTLASASNGKKPGKTFWEAPEDVIDEKLDGKLTAFEKRLLETINKRESLNQETTQWKQEGQEAAEFIQKQKGMTPDDIQMIEDLVRETPAMQGMRPMERAEYALFLWQKQRGIGNNSLAKARASMVVGQPPASGGPRQWTKAAIDAEMAKFPNDPKNWTPEQNKAFDEFERELRQARLEGRMK
jgi:hypothetical protein